MASEPTAYPDKKPTQRQRLLEGRVAKLEVEVSELADVVNSLAYHVRKLTGVQPQESQLWPVSM